MTELHKAAMAGDTSAIVALIEGGTDVNADDRGDGVTALHEAAGNGHTETCAVLIDYGARIEAKDFVDNTPLRWAVLNGHPETAELLRSRGADTPWSRPSGRTPHGAQAAGPPQAQAFARDRSE
jgi:ankyrin repeat protein